MKSLKIIFSNEKNTENIVIKTGEALNLEISSKLILS